FPGHSPLPHHWRRGRAAGEQSRLEGRDVPRDDRRSRARDPVHRGRKAAVPRSPVLLHRHYAARRYAAELGARLGRVLVKYVRISHAWRSDPGGGFTRHGSILQAAPYISRHFGPKPTSLPELAAANQT